MAKEYVPIYFDWLEATQDLTPEEKGNLIDAVVSYASGQEYEHYLTGGCRIAFRFLKGQVDRNTAISDVRRNARVGKTQQASTNSNKAQQNTSNDNKAQQTKSNLPKEKEKEEEKEKDKDKEVKEPRARFTPPTVDEVAQYCRERGNRIDPNRFVDFYAAKGWRVGNQAMKDWKACVRTWEQRDKGSAPVKSAAARQYTGRETPVSESEQFDAMLRRLDSMGV